MNNCYICGQSYRKSSLKPLGENYRPICCACATSNGEQFAMLVKANYEILRNNFIRYRVDQNYYLTYAEAVAVADMLEFAHVGQ